MQANSIFGFGVKNGHQGGLLEGSVGDWERIWAGFASRMRGIGRGTASRAGRVRTAGSTAPLVRRGGPLSGWARVSGRHQGGGLLRLRVNALRQARDVLYPQQPEDRDREIGQRRQHVRAAVYPDPLS